MTDASVTYLRIECPTCLQRFVPNYLQVKNEMLIVCPHCLTPYVPANLARPAVHGIDTKKVPARRAQARKLPARKMQG